jgi:hypothetical protein
MPAAILFAAMERSSTHGERTSSMAAFQIGEMLIHKL